MGFKPMIQTANDPKYYPNALVFATPEEAEAWAKDLFKRWLLMTDHRVDEVDDQPTHTFTDGVLASLEQQHET